MPVYIPAPREQRQARPPGIADIAAGTCLGIVLAGLTGVVLAGLWVLYFLH